MKIELLEIAGLKPAVHAMRNPMNSWGKSDSGFQTVIDDEGEHQEFTLGRNDLMLMQNLNNAGVEHRTFARMIQVWSNLELPIYVWKEMDRYTVGKTQVSCSTMHKIHSKEFTKDDFQIDSLEGVEASRAMDTMIKALNRAREDYLNETKPDKKKRYWKTMIQLLPESYIQKRTIMMSYEVCMKIWKERRNHKLSEWHSICEWIESLPYFTDIMEITKG